MAKEQDNEVKGILEITEKGHGFVRTLGNNYAIKQSDPLVTREVIKKNYLRSGAVVTGVLKRQKNRSLVIENIVSVGELDPDKYMEVAEYDSFTVIDPCERIRLATGQDPLGTRAIDILTPIGKGQRGLIVSPPRTGKTILLQQIANGITTNHSEIHLMVLLIDERPEEVTDMKRQIQGEVIASSNDKEISSHVRIARLAIDRAKRLVEMGKDVVILLDSITRLGRAFNSWIKSSGRTMSGGIDIRSLQLPKQIFGSARNIEGSGSLTILATALIDTGSRMDEVIFQEFKGTGNMELVLDRELANRRVFPAIDIVQSGTRKEELLIPPEELEKIHRLRRHLDSMPAGQDVTMFIQALKKHKSNESFIATLP